MTYNVFGGTLNLAQLQLQLPVPGDYTRCAARYGRLAYA